jgi:organic radical activating enzyme
MYNAPDNNLQDPRVFVPYVEFYITNVCNIKCSNCNRFNDHEFKGWQRWSDYQHLYEQWASRIRLQRIAILGGEPLLNPSLMDWVDGINRLWNKPVQVLTNGTRLNSFPDLYERMLAWNSVHQRWIRNWIGVSLHNPNDKERCFEEIRKFMKGNVKFYHKDDPENANNTKTQGGDWGFIDSNGMKVCVWLYDSFYPAAIQKNALGQYTVFNNDPLEAHNECGFVQFKSYHFIKGAIYKCGSVALFPEFDKQHPLQISEQDRALINSYQPYTIEVFDQQGLSGINDPIPQCKFCPAGKNQPLYQLFAVSKKTGSTSSYD